MKYVQRREWTQALFSERQRGYLSTQSSMLTDATECRGYYRVRVSRCNCVWQ
jgi:hypothetical protein